MPAGDIILYSTNKDNLNIDALVAGTVKLALVDSSYVPDFAIGGDQVWADVSADEIANGFGYTTGGISLSSMVATAVTGGFKFSSASPVWTASGGPIPAWRFGVLYYVGSLWGLTNPLVGAFLGDDSPADVPATTDGNTLTITTPAAGWFDAT